MPDLPQDPAPERHADALPDKRITLRVLRDWVSQARPIPVLTCYDATTARWLWRGRIPCMLVGDTAAQVILGHDTTLPAPVSFMVQITAAVRRGAPNAFVIADMPFASYHCGDDDATRNAARFMTDGMADAVKLEVGPRQTELVARLTDAGVPVVAHIGSRPQQVRVRGGYGSVGRSQRQLRELIDTTTAMVQAGAGMILIEAVPAETCEKLMHAAAATAEQLEQPQPIVIGCGAGPACHAHVVVLHDLLGLSAWQPPFAKPLADLGQKITDAAGQWDRLVRSGRYLRDDHPYQMNPPPPKPS